jgi:hypothetical protein
MNARHGAVIDEVVEVLADGLRRHLETPGEVLHHHPTEGAGNIEDLGLAVAQAHGGASRDTGRMVLRFGDAVNWPSSLTSKSAPHPV